MNQAEARRWIKKHYGSAKKFEQSQVNPPPKSEFLAALDQVPNLRAERECEKAALELFLWAGCRLFDRWFVPSPPSVPASHRDNFRRFAVALSKHERVPMNSSIFLIHAVRDEIYSEFSDLPLPLSQLEAGALKAVTSRLTDIPNPENPTKVAEVLAAKVEIEQIVDGLLEGSLISHLRTLVPYPVVRQPIVFNLRWNGISVEGRLTPSFLAPPPLLMQVQPPTVLAPRGSTRWQYGQTRIEFDFSALVDASLQEPSLQMPSMDVPIDAWPNAAFALRSSCSIRPVGSFVGILSSFVFGFLPPGDLGEIESWVSSPTVQKINYIRRVNPSMVYEAFVPPEAMLELELGIATSSPWHMKCRVMADQYAKFGETREALFWLNVGVEGALLQTRMEHALVVAGLDLDLETLGADPLQEVKEAVAAKCPELLDEIDWPAGWQKPNRFRQIKYFCRNVPEAPDVKVVKANYGKVSRRRNALFHGEAEDSIPLEDVRVAIEGFDWLADNFYAGARMI